MIIVTGSLAFDYIFNFPGKFSDHIMIDKIHSLNLSFLTQKLNKNFGGTACNISYNLALLGKKPIVLATAGKDFPVFRRFLSKKGVVTKYIKIIKRDFSSNYFALVDLSDNQIGGFYSGAMEKAVNLSLKDIKEKISFVIISPTEPKAMIKFVKECWQNNLPYLFDPGMQLPRLTKRDLQQGIEKAEILIGNDYEISLIKKILNYSERQLLQKVKILITTLAGQGSIIATNKQMFKIKAAKVTGVADPVGAGDAYRAGFIAGYLKDFSLKVCSQMGAVAAAYAVEKYGTTAHQFTKKQFCDRYKENYDLTTT